MVESTSDIGLQAPTKYIGDESPIKYDRVDRLPIYSLPVNQLDMSQDNLQGIKLDFSGDGVMLPGTIIPKPNDFFIIPIVGVEYLFKVTSVNADTVRSNNYFKIEFKFSKINDGSIDKLVRGNFEVIYDNIGSTSKAVIEDTDLNEVENLLNLVYRIREDLVKAHYDNDTNFFIFDKFFYDPWINTFLKNTNILNHKSFKRTININDVITFDESVYPIQYRLSFLELLKEVKPKYLMKSNRVTALPVTRKKGNVFDIYKSISTVYELHRVDFDTDNSEEITWVDFEPFKTNPYLDMEFVSKCVSGVHYDNATDFNILRNYVIDYFFKKSADVDVSVLEEAYEDMCYDCDKKYRKFDEFVILIAIIFIMKNKINIILETK